MVNLMITLLIRSLVGIRLCFTTKTSAVKIHYERIKEITKMWRLAYNHSELHYKDIILA